MESPDVQKVRYRGLFTFRQAALWFGKSEAWVRQEVESGNLGIVLLESKRYVPRQECERYLFERTRYASKAV